MGKPTGFLEYTRCEDETVPAKERIKNYSEFHRALDAEKRKEQGARCMNCGVPMCQSAISLKGMVTGCPLHNLIPEWNDEIYRGHIAHALSRLLKTSNFPEFTGRVCPALCEKACICGLDSEPVTVHNNELYLIESAFSQGLMTPRIPKVRSGKKVAVVGSGPSGLAVADQLNHRGHSVTVYERDDRIGGLMMYGIPNMKLDKSVIERRRKLMEEEGIIFLTGVNVGVDVSAEELLSGYDAVALCCGAKKARSLAVDGIDKTEGVHFAVDYLKSTTKSLLESGLEEGTYISAKDKRVVIVGGGDTGNDCLATCIRHGCSSAVQLEMMPAPPGERDPGNPWPEWPNVLKTDYGQQEAIALFGKDPRVYETTVKELITEGGRLKGIRTVRLDFSGGKMSEVPGSEEELGCDLLIIAAGFTGCEEYTAQAFKAELTRRGIVMTEEGRYRVGTGKVFSAGDMHRGQSLVVWAIAEGRDCAREIDEYLMGYTNM